MGRHSKKVRVKSWHKVALAASAIGLPVTTLDAASAATTLPDVFNAIVRCESGGNLTVENPVGTASGKYQFLDSSWHAYGGGKYASRAKFATEAEQDAVALTAYNQSGTSPWNASRSCWQHGAPIPVRALTPVPTSATATATPRHAARTYVVQPGDSLAKIAREQGIVGGFHALFKINRCNIKHPNLIFPGQRINL